MRKGCIWRRANKSEEKTTTEKKTPITEGKKQVCEEETTMRDKTKF